MNSIHGSMSELAEVIFMINKLKFYESYLKIIRKCINDPKTPDDRRKVFIESKERVELKEREMIHELMEKHGIMSKNIL